MGKSLKENLFSATKCHKLNFACASPVSLCILIAIAVLTAATRNYFTDIVTKISDDVGNLVCATPEVATKTRQAILDGVNNNPAFIQANTLFQNYVTAFGGAIIAFHIIVIQLFHCCSIFKRSRLAHICGVFFVTIGMIIFAAAGLAIMAIGRLIDQTLDCVTVSSTPYSLSTSFCTDITSFNPALYFASTICATLVPTLMNWAIAMFALAVTGIFASFSGCCLDGCCNCKKTFDQSSAPVAAHAVQMSPIVPDKPFQGQPSPSPLPAAYKQDMQASSGPLQP